MDNKESSKKVKYAYEPAKMKESDEDEGNDLDLDTIKSAKSKGLKEFDSEDELEEEDDDYEETKEFLIETDSENSEIESVNESDVDERAVPIVPFNLKEDREEGNFDSEGFYTRKQDEEADQDRWMSNFTRSDIIKARKAHEAQEQKLKKLSESSVKSEKELYEELAGLLDENSDMTVLQMIRFLKQVDGKASAPLNKNRLKKLLKEQQTVQQQQQEGGDKVEREKKLERITEIADALMDYGNYGVYEETRREILNKIKKS